MSNVVKFRSKAERAGGRISEAVESLLNEPLTVHDLANNRRDVMRFEDMPARLTGPEIDAIDLFHVRDWLEASVNFNGAETRGAGISEYGADLDILLDGKHWNISIRPIPNTDEGA